MGTCLMCHRKIPNGQKFCENCKQKRKTKADESYLDSLLSSVGEIRPEPKNESKPDKQPFGDYPAYTDNNSISRGNKPVQKTEAEAPAEMDDMLTDLLNDMDEAGEFEQQPENNIGEDDIENIFDEAEAYAELLSKDQNQEEQNENRNTAMFEHLDEQQTLSGEETDSGLSDQDFIDVNWNESSGDNDYIPEQEIDDGFNEEDEIILNEGYNNVEAAFSDFDPLNEEIEAEAKPKSKKDSWFKRLIIKLFGNVNDDVTPEMIEADKIKKAEEEEIEKQKRLEKKKLDEERKAEAMAEKERKKAEADAERNRKLALSIEKKNAAKEKEKKKKEQALAIAEYELEHGKINKAGATILFVIFAILTIVIIIGTNIYSYNLSIKNAQEDFDVQKYNEAYYEVYGLKIQDEDIELYDRIMTVMYVNTQLNAYEYYMTSKNKEKALDSLLKGLQRYEKYYQLAQRLGITDDLNYVKGEILNKLTTEFNLSEEEANNMIKVDNTVDYSEYLYELLGDYPEELKKYK